jgi:hypothetical protein
MHWRRSDAGAPSTIPSTASGHHRRRPTRRERPAQTDSIVGWANTGRRRGDRDRLAPTPRRLGTRLRHRGGPHPSRRRIPPRTTQHPGGNSFNPETTPPRPSAAGSAWRRSATQPATATRSTDYSRHADRRCDTRRGITTCCQIRAPDAEPTASVRMSASDDPARVPGSAQRADAGGPGAQASSAK